jgi:hypothetical protein
MENNQATLYVLSSYGPWATQNHESEHEFDRPGPAHGREAVFYLVHGRLGYVMHILSMLGNATFHIDYWYFKVGLSWLWKDYRFRLVCPWQGSLGFGLSSRW